MVTQPRSLQVGRFVQGLEAAVAVASASQRMQALGVERVAERAVAAAARVAARLEGRTPEGSSPEPESPVGAGSRRRKA